jgi:nicotinate-nucleotide adenylyltransferase
VNRLTKTETGAGAAGAGEAVNRLTKTNTKTESTKPKTDGRATVRLGILGGTFDPVHVGHLAAGVSARHTLGLERVLFVVANAPWQKQGRRLAPAQDRLDMVAAAVEGIDGLEASAIEIERGGTTYTADTLRTLAERHPEAELYLIVGSDVAEDLHTWERQEEIKQRSTLAVVTRAGAGETHQQLHGWRTARVEMPLLDVSSTELRQWLAQGRPVDGLVPPGAVRLLRERALYAGPG